MVVVLNSLSDISHISIFKGQFLEINFVPLLGLSFFVSSCVL